MAKKDLVRLLVQLFGDPNLHDRIRKNPHAELAKLGLSKRERELILSRDEKALRTYLGKEAARLTIVIQWMPTDEK